MSIFNNYVSLPEGNCPMIQFKTFVFFSNGWFQGDAPPLNPKHVASPFLSHPICEVPIRILARFENANLPPIIIHLKRIFHEENIQLLG